MPYLDDENNGLAAKDLGVMGRHELQTLRKGRGAAAQAFIAPFEHRAYAREYVQDKGMTGAASLVVAIPAYTAAKALGIVKARSPASVEEIKQGFTGVYEGLKRRKQ